MDVKDVKGEILSFDGKSFKIDYQLSSFSNNELMGSGSIYWKGEDEDPFDFSFTTMKGTVPVFAPMNLTKEFKGAIVEKVTGQQIPVISV